MERVTSLHMKEGLQKEKLKLNKKNTSCYYYFIFRGGKRKRNYREEPWCAKKYELWNRHNMTARFITQRVRFHLGSRICGRRPWIYCCCMINGPC